MIDTKNVIELKPIDQKPVEELSTTVATMTQQPLITIKNQADYELAANQLRGVKQMIKTVEEKRKGFTVPIDALKKAAQNLFMPMLTKLEGAERNIKNAMIAFTDEQERIRRAEEARLQEKAEKERQAALKRAEEARAKGNEAKAEALQEKAAAIVAPVLAPRVENVAGASFVTRWSAEVLDFALLPDEFKLPDMAKLNARARVDKEHFNIPGATAKAVKDMSQRV